MAVGQELEGKVPGYVLARGQNGRWPQICLHTWNRFQNNCKNLELHLCVRAKFIFCPPPGWFGSLPRCSIRAWLGAMQHDENSTDDCVRFVALQRTGG